MGFALVAVAIYSAVRQYALADVGEYLRQTLYLTIICAVCRSLPVFLSNNKAMDLSVISILTVSYTHLSAHTDMPQSMPARSSIIPMSGEETQLPASMHRFISVEASSVLEAKPAQAVPSATGISAPQRSEQASTQPHLSLIHI